jgi:hypothetical protein
MPAKFMFEIANAILEARKEIRDKKFDARPFTGAWENAVYISDVEKAFDKLLSGFAVTIPNKKKEKQHG